MKYFVVDAFAEHVFGGNPAGVCVLEKPMDTELMQRIAAENPNITAQVYDLNHFPDLRDKYQVMSVPCLVVNGGEQVTFGKKNIQQLLEFLS